MVLGTGKILHITSSYTSETGHLQCLGCLVEAQSFLSSNKKLMITTMSRIMHVLQSRAREAELMGNTHCKIELI